MERTVVPLSPRRRVPPGRCDTCKFSSPELRFGQEVLVCRHSPLNAMPIMAQDKKGLPFEAGMWSGVTITRPEEWCYQYQLDLAP